MTPLQLTQHAQLAWDRTIKVWLPEHVCPVWTGTSYVVLHQASQSH